MRLLVRTLPAESMSVHATVDVVVHFHRFKNIDLYARGMYVTLPPEQGLVSDE